MKARRDLVFSAALAVVLVANHEVRADPIHWSYVSSIFVQPPISDPPGPGTPFAPFIIYAQNHVAGFSSDFPGPSGSFAGSSKILVGNLWPFDFDKSPNAGPIGLGTSYETDILVT